MFEYLSQTHDNVVAIKASDKLTHEDYQQFLARFEEVIDRFGKLRVLFDMTDLHGWECSAMWDDLKFEFHHCHQIERCGIVGDKKWQEWMVRLTKPFYQAEVRYFDRDQLDEAAEWIGQPVHAG